MNGFLSSSESLGRGNYFRLLVLGCVDAIILLPAQILNLIIACQFTTQPEGDIFYPGWTAIHSDWAPVSLSAYTWRSSVWGIFSVRWSEWINVFFGVLFFLLFGATAEAWESYKRMFFVVANQCGYSRPVQAKMSDVVFQSVVFSTVDSMYVFILVMILIYPFDTLH